MTNHEEIVDATYSKKELLNLRGANLYDAKLTRWDTDSQHDQQVLNPDDMPCISWIDVARTCAQRK